MATFQQAVQARALAIKQFDRFGEVVGIAIIPLADGCFGLKVNFRKSPKKRSSTPMPDKVDDVPVVKIEVVGTVEAHM